LAEVTQLFCLQEPRALQALQEAADELRHQQVGDSVGWGVSVPIFYTNLCEMAPTLYSYPRQLGEQGAYTYTVDDFDARLEAAERQGVKRVFLTGGLWSGLQIPGMKAAPLLQVYGQMVSYIREYSPILHIEGFSPDEIDFLHIISGRTWRYILEYLKDMGLNSLSGHGAEILVESVRQKISPKKMEVKDWFKVMALAHQLEIPATVTMAYGHYETLAQRAQHLIEIRQFLDKYPAGFSAFTPMPVGENPKLTPLVVSPLSWKERLKVLAITRLVLGHLLPVQQVHGPGSHPAEEVQEGLLWGANHLGSGDNHDYMEFLQGSREQTWLSEGEIRGLIHAAGRTPQPVPT
jgi:FO synthase subunit 2